MTIIVISLLHAYMYHIFLCVWIFFSDQMQVSNYVAENATKHIEKKMIHVRHR